jgi:Icc-related predicted phosphoesterase
MKILAVADIHQSNIGHHGKDCSENFARFLKVLDFEKPDLILICGDLGDVSNKDMEALYQKSVNSGFKVLIIAGNHDNINVIANSKMYIDGLERIGKITIAGIGGIVAPIKHDEILKFAEDDLVEKADKIAGELNKIGDGLDILMTHEMPKIRAGYGDDFYDERSSSVFGKILYILKPKLSISGHLHGEKTLIVEYEYGTLINLGAFSDGYYAVIEAETDPFKIEKIDAVSF